MACAVTSAKLYQQAKSYRLLIKHQARIVGYKRCRRHMVVIIGLGEVRCWNWPRPLVALLAPRRNRLVNQNLAASDAFLRSLDLRRRDEGEI